MPDEPRPNPDASRVPDDPPPLGQILVDTGLVETADLENVLEQQRQTNEPLGRLLVDGGYVAPHSIALALAKQHGGPLKTEYGFAAPSLSEPTPDQRAARRHDELQRKVEDAARRLEAASVTIERLEAELRAERERVADMEREAEVAREPAAGPAQTEDGHVLFVASSEGYLLVERAGPPPQVAEIVGLPEIPGSYRVVRLGVSPLPGDTGRCAYLERQPQ